MSSIKIPPYIRSNEPALALWQSAVASVNRKRLKTLKADLPLVQLHHEALMEPMVLGANIHVSQVKNNIAPLAVVDLKEYFPQAGNKGNIHPVLHSYLSNYYFDQAKKLQAGEISNISLPPIEFPDSDYAYKEWAGAAAEWTAFWNNAKAGPLPYIDWQAQGLNISTFSVITIPANAKIAIIGDFGTGLPDATVLIIAMLRDLNPDIIIHLGDIYYAGTTDECQAYNGAFNMAFAALNIPPKPVFSIPGNHEYISGGLGFFNEVIGLNAQNNLTQYAQPASYFCLRTADNNWQFLAMDTGLNADIGTSAVSLKNAYSPWLKFSETLWLLDKLNNFSGPTVLLSHHQLFSASSVINDGSNMTYQSGTSPQTYKYLNGNLQNVFSPYYNNIPAWFWGHEHILAIYENSQMGLQRGRLIGNSGYEEWQGENPYTQPGDNTYAYNTSVQQLDQTNISWMSSNYNFYDHGFALLQLNGNQASVQYYEYPIMEPGASIPPVSLIPSVTQLNFTETF